MEVLAWALAVTITTPFLILTVEILFGLAKANGQEFECSTPSKDIAILIPAHNEAHGIADYLASLKSVTPSDTRIVLVADNCTDNTAELARLAGVEVIERHDADRRGKVFALAFGRDWLANAPPSCVIIIDADCLPEPDAISRLAAVSCARQTPIQACNLLVADLDADPRVQMSNFAFWIKNLIRTRGMFRLSHTCLLLGTGMAIPWTLLQNASLDTNALAEDAALGIDLMKAGHPPQFLESARVTSAAASMSDTLVQRTRWEHGFIDMTTRHAFPLFISGIAKLNLAQIWTGLHLMVPALALLAVVGVISLAALTLTTSLTGTFAPSVALGIAMTTAFSLVAFAWLKEGRSVMSARAAFSLPLYVLWKLPVYLKLFGKKETSWIRTKRPGE
jgi:cellulose synthase/poly-beta-1,6-N-acetylglucosamine synthase-like glycosyltransferase